MDTKGGRVTIQASGSDGAFLLSTRGKLTLDVSTVEIAAGANNDGTGYRTVKPTLAKAGLTFEVPDGIAIDTAFMLDTYDVTFSEDDVGATHLFTGATFTGRPSKDTETGEVSGLSIETDTYMAL